MRSTIRRHRSSTAPSPKAIASSPSDETTRTLEAVAGAHGGRSFRVKDDDLFIYPGFEFRVIRGLLTNFHLPRSSLLMLVAAFAGRDRVRDAYAAAIAAGARFYSYGDAMLIT
jgi:S-adenosylmethionine:tRNA ribosyltransferase-isomerase